ncbi:MFS transporter [Corynebacterium ammoniagenes]|uniref:MFS transporter n=1 Tax=Corynebacterium ammoniagenes TaxID=1697 RepID=UPI0014599D7F|nr:MFS transporter [Corynebacterium ammoniagenes]NMF32214.1 MFS transporter [Corynebacterium ammoniagenes]
MTSPAIDNVPDSAKRTDKLTVFSWAMWDWGSAAFNAVLVTFIFSVYLTDSVGAQIDTARTPAQWLSLSMTIAGLIIFAVTPIMGQRSDTRGTRRRSLATWSFLTFLLMAALFFIRNDAPEYFWIGLTVLAIGTITIEFAEVNYFAQLSQVSTKENVGKISGLGWSFGYFGGIVLLLICYFGFVAGDGGLLGISTEGGLNIRLVAVLAAVWFGLSFLPGLFRVPEIPPSGEKASGIAGSYAKLFRDIKELWNVDRNACYFLFASAIFRDGLAGVFAFGAVLGVSVYGLNAGDVLIFGVAANVAAALGALIGGLIDDHVGPKLIILTSLFILAATGSAMYFVDGPVAFWILGLILCLFVGPAQSASRGFLARVAPVGHEGQLFGLYATTGRAVSWMTPLLFGVFVSLIGEGDRGGVLAIALVLLIGALILIPVRDPKSAEPAH